MPRPVKVRRVRCSPEANYFKPRGVPVAVLEEVVLLKDEVEAIRLADLDELYQQEAADNMNVSRQTFGNIIRSAHHKIADALVNGKALRIEGGVVIMKKDNFNVKTAITNGQCRLGPEGPQIVRSVRKTTFLEHQREKAVDVAAEPAKIKNDAGGRINENLYPD